MVISIRFLKAVGAIWLLLPIVLFMAGWLRPVIGIPMAGIAVAVSVILIRSCLKDTAVARFEIKNLAIIMSLIFLAVLASGIGGFMYQLPLDHSVRNTIFENLVKREWPVCAYGDGEPTFLCYYIGFWLPSALVAKIAGGSMLIGNISMVLYAFIGLSTSVLLILWSLRNYSPWLVILFFAYCGWDVVICLLLKDSTYPNVFRFLLDNKEMASWWFAAPTLPIMLFYIYNQGIAVWVGTVMLWTMRDKPEVMLLLFAGLLSYSPISAVGLMPFVAFALLRRWRRAFSFVNAGAFVICLILAAYYMSNMNSGNYNFLVQDVKLLGFVDGKANLFVRHADPLVYLYHLIVFALFSYGVYLPFIWREVRHDKLFWFMMGWSLCLPVIVLGDGFDFGLRVSMPFVCYYMFKVMSAASRMKWHTLRSTLFATMLFVGFIGGNFATYGFAAICDINVLRGKTSTVEFVVENLWTREDNHWYNNFMGRYNSFFARKLMKRNGIPTAEEGKGYEKASPKDMVETRERQDLSARESL